MSWFLKFKWSRDTIDKVITFTGFKDPNAQEVNYLQFRNQDSYNLGDPNKLSSEWTGDWLKNQIIANKESIFIIPNGWDTNFDWFNSIKFENKNERTEEGILEIDVKVIKAGENNKDVSRKLKFTGFKKGIPYNISINEGLNEMSGFPYGDSNKKASEVDEKWVKQQVITNKNKIFQYTTLPDNYDWESNIEIERYNLFPNDLGRSLSFELTLLKLSNTSTQPISKRITFNDFKQEQWNTSSMPTDDELLISNLQFPTGTNIQSYLNNSNKSQKLNEYGVVRSFALINRILLDSLFVNQGFTNTSILMKNTNFNTLEFVISGIASKSITSWGKNSIPISGIVEQWNGINVTSGQKIELTIRYTRNSGSALGTDKFDLSQLITWNGSGISGLNWPTWKGRLIKFIYLNEFNSWGSIKQNGSIVHQSSKTDGRSMFVFMHTYNGSNYFVDSNSILD